MGKRTRIVLYALSLVHIKQSVFFFTCDNACNGDTDYFFTWKTER